MDFIFGDFEMSLTYFILNGFEVNPDYYACPDDVSLRPVGVRQKFWGAYFFLTIATSDLMKTPAYKSMFVLAIYDISSTFMHSIATGVFGFYGVAYCDYPRLNLVFGSIALGSWLGCCITSMLLLEIVTFVRR
ncbi:hypothetical protein GCK72_020230 [Caenorhabditis remanei]|uniref:Uncharacterized protein n=1 Tax=Caenorhabditis remanei TaxID=31234 RepID=A0A6A5GG71_CAERE|nr:hypothetical protein GCK72_020230 [Caenorhabditis remanei]KAF1753673.1 hypothetical protein GCK72_020230 [Caenorhabditis remanei]